MQGARLSRPRSGRVGEEPAPRSSLAAALCGPPPAAAGPAWLERQDSRPTGRTPKPRRSRSTRPATRPPSGAGSTAPTTSIQSATRPAGGSWSAPVDLSAPGEEAQSPAAGGRRRRATRPPSGPGSTAPNPAPNPSCRAPPAPPGAAGARRSTSRPAGRNAELPQVAVDGSGAAVAIWRSFDGNNFVIQAASRPAGGGWDGPADLSATGHDGMDPRLALDAAGDATAVWSRFNGAKPASHSVIQAASRLAGGAWEEAVDISDPAQNAQTPAVSVDGSGTVTAVWSRFDGSDFIVQAASDPGGAAGGKRLTSRGRAAAHSPPPSPSTPRERRSRSSRGPTASAGRSSRSPHGPRPAAPGKRRPTSRRWKEQRLPPRSRSTTRGRRSRSGCGRTVLRRSSPGRSGPPGLVAAGGRSLRNWEPGRANRRSSSTQAATASPPGSSRTARRTSSRPVAFDGAPPALRSLSIPTAATVRRPVGFSVAPFDVWSAIGPIGWSFDDGTECRRRRRQSHLHGGRRPHRHRHRRRRPGQRGEPHRLGHRLPRRPRRALRIRPRAAGPVGLRCPSPAGCGGQVRLNVIERVGRHGRRFRAGAAQFEMPGVDSATLAVPLSQGRPPLCARRRRRGSRRS